jgi:WhiB family redox-sensing transcriptional regulator
MPDPAVDWRHRAACLGLDPDLFFDPARADAARLACHACPVRVECLAFATEHRTTGVWGGETADARVRLARAGGQRTSTTPLSDRRDLHARIDHLTRIGLPATKVAELVGVTSRTVNRQRARRRQGVDD